MGPSGLMAQRPAFQEVARVVTGTDDATVVQCAAGKDRTGGGGVHLVA